MSDEMVIYALEPDLSVEDFRSVLLASTLGERRPIDDAARLAQMLTEADVIVTARVGGRIAGVSRALTDFSFATYLSDLAVDREYQGLGIGRELIQRTHEAAGRQTMLVLVAAPGARTYYPHIGLEPHDSCWMISRNA
jgi:predicted N-acetyltransferase YhbS